MSKCTVGNNKGCDDYRYQLPIHDSDEMKDFVEKQEQVCFPKELSINYCEGIEIDGECEQYNKRVGRNKNVYILDDYVVRFEKIRGKIFEQTFDYGNIIFKTIYYPKKTFINIENRLIGCDAAAKLVHFNRYKNKMIFIHENIIKGGFNEIQNDVELMDSLNILNYCEEFEKTDDMINLFLKHHNNAEKKISYFLKHYKFVFEQWFEQNRVFFENLFFAIYLIVSRGVYHRDVSTENVFINETGNIKFIDWEYSEIVEQELPDYYVFKHFIRSPMNIDEDPYYERFFNDAIWGGFDTIEEFSLYLNVDFVMENNKHLINQGLENFLHKLNKIHDYFIHFLCTKYTKFMFQIKI